MTATALPDAVPGRTVDIRDRRVMLDGEPAKLLSGAIHYFRTLPQDWRDRLEKLKSLGCNCVETYVAWNLHEPRKGEFTFDGIADLERFLDLSAELGLHAIVRPGPYICAEWDFGGLPWWLLERDAARVRCAEPTYLGHVEDWFKVLLPKVASRQHTRGGNVIAVQVENEYGYYGNDDDYLAKLKQFIVDGGIEVPLFTSDSPDPIGQRLGNAPGTIKTGNFGGDVENKLAVMAELEKDGPASCMEFWVGWFDTWGNAKHSSRPAADAADAFGKLLDRDALVNFYMFHGGTNFAFMSGGNCSDQYEPHVTSYDYDALLTEDGRTTQKFDLCRDVAREHGFCADDRTFEPAKRVTPTTVKLDAATPLSEVIEKAAVHRDVAPLRLEKLGHGSGYAHYRTTVPALLGGMKVVLREMRDFATVLVDGKVVGSAYRVALENGSAQEIRLPRLEQDATVEVLVENMGRPNFGHRMTEPKGIDGRGQGGVYFGDRRHDERTTFRWESRALPLDDVDGIAFNGKPGDVEGPGFFRGTFELGEGDLGDAFLAVPSLTKGVVFLNGFNLGRLWNVGPQRTLYAPRHLLKAGSNEVVVFDSVGLESPASATVELRDAPDLG